MARASGPVRRDFSGRKATLMANSAEDISESSL